MQKMTLGVVMTLILAVWQPAPRAQTADFSDWLEALKAEALTRGISQATVDAAFAEVARPVERVIELDRRQPESRLDFWDYVGRVVSEQRIQQGRAMLEAHRELLADVAERYGIPARILVAAWGIESNFGTVTGSFPVINSLVTLAYDERRAAFFRGELFNALRILDEGHVRLPDMQGSWAGAMGQLQFMPSTFIDYARDGDGDGRKDIWNSVADAMESAANYMAAGGWQPGYIWGRQARLPADFDTGWSGLDNRRSLGEWQSVGVRRADGSDLPATDIPGSIVLPSDDLEPAFLVYANYRVIRRWNRSHLFAISLGHLADRIAGGAPLRRSQDGQ